MQTSLFCRIMAVVLMLCMLAGMVPVIAAETASSVESDFTSLPEEKPETKAIPTTSSLINQINNLKIPNVTQVNNWDSLDGYYFMVCANRTFGLTRSKSIGYLNIADDESSLTPKWGLTSVPITISNNRVKINGADADLTHLVRIYRNTYEIDNDLKKQLNTRLVSELAAQVKNSSNSSYNNKYMYNLLKVKDYESIDCDLNKYTYNIQFYHNKNYLWFGLYEGIEPKNATYPMLLHPSTDTNLVKLYKTNYDGTNNSSGSLVLSSYWIGVDCYGDGNVSPAYVITGATANQLRRNNFGGRSNWTYNQGKFNSNWAIYKLATMELIPLYEALRSSDVKNFISAGNASGTYSEEAYNGYLLTVQNAINYYNANYLNNSPSSTIVNQANAYSKIVKNSITQIKKETSDKTALNNLNASSTKYLDLPMTVLDFRADGIMFENNGSNSPYGFNPYTAEQESTIETALSVQAPGKNEGGNRVGLTLENLVGGYPVYTQESVTFIATGLYKKYQMRDASYFDVYWNNLFYDMANGGFADTDGDGDYGLGTWERTLAKTSTGENGGILLYKDVDTAYDLAYYVLNYLWRPVGSDDTLFTSQTVNGNTFPVHYNKVVNEVNTLRLKMGSDGFYTFQSKLDVGRDLDTGIVFNTGNTDDGTAPGFNILADLGFDHPDLYGNNNTGSIGDYNGSSTTNYASRSNYNYGIHIHSAFVYYDAKDLQFTFTGDDDVYFFVNGVLVCDIGGMHTAVTKTLHINDVASKLDLEDGDICTFDMFFVDRHTSEINLNFSTNIEMMAASAITREEQHLYTEAGVINDVIREGSVVEDQTEVSYTYMLLNRSDYGANHLSFTDAQLGVTLTKDQIDLNGKAEVQDLIVTYRGYDPNTSKYVNTLNDSLDYSGVADEAFAESDFYTLISGAVYSKTTTTPFKELAYRITGLSENKLKALLELGVPANTQIEIYGMHQTALLSVGTCMSTLQTVCYPLDTYDLQGSPLTGNDKRTVQIIEQSTFTVNAPLQLVIDYGKSVEIPVEDLTQTITTSGGAVATFLGFMDEGRHGLIMTAKPSNIKCTTTGETYATPNGIYEYRGNVYRFTPSRFLEEIDRVNAVYSISSLNAVDRWFVIVSLEIIPATMVYYEAEDFVSSEFTYEELTAEGSKSEFTVVKQEYQKSISDTAINTYSTQPDPTYDQNILYFGFGDTTQDRLRYEKNPIYGSEQLDTVNEWWYDTNTTNWTMSLTRNNGIMKFTGKSEKDTLDYCYIGSGKDSSGNRNYPLRYVPSEEDWMEIRFRIEGTTTGTYNFKLEMFNLTNGNADNHYNHTFSLPSDAFTDGYYVLSDHIGRRTVSDSTTDRGTTDYKRYADLPLITRVNLLFGGIQPKTNVTIYIDYFYIGPKESAPSSQDGYLLFDFDQSAAAQYRYQTEVYDGINYDLETNWRYTGGRTEAPEILSGALKMTASVDNTENYYWVRTANDEVNNGVKYLPSERDYCQVKLKVENGQPIDPYVTVYFATGPEGIKDKNQESFHFKLTDINGDWVTLSFPIKNSRWYNADVITDLQLTVGGIGSTEGQRVSIYIDYFYIGPAQSQDFAANSSPDVYGYDTSYTDDRGLSDGESLFIEGQGIKSAGSATYCVATFTFKGTGFDLISRTGVEQATIRVTAYNTAGEIERYITVNNKGELELYQIPVVSMENLPYGVYTVTVEVNKAQTYSGVLAPLSRGGKFYLDAVRIYDPIFTSKDTLSEDEETALSAYTEDGEAYPYRKEVRDIILSAEDFDGLTGETNGVVYIDQAEEAPKETQPDDSADATEYVPIDPETGLPVESLPIDPDISVDNHITGSIATYEKIGPKNEVYLSGDQSIAFKLRLNTNEIPVSIDIGAKAINTGDTPKLTVGHTTTTTAPTVVQAWDVATNTAQYYTANITAQDFGTDADGKYLYLVIANKNENTVLSITDLKFGYDTKYTLIQQGNPPVQTPTKGEVAVSSPISFTVDRELTRAAYRILSAELPKDDPVVVDETISIRHTLNLASDISVNYAILAESLADYDSFYLSCVLYNGATVDLEPVLKGDYYYFTLSGLTAVTINDEIKATLYMTSGEQRFTSSTDSYSVSRYAYSQLNKEGMTAELKALCANLLRYGALAQQFKDYRTHDLADSRLTEEQKAYLTDLDTVSFGSNNSTGTELSDPAVVWVGKALDLTSKVGLTFVFTVTDPTIPTEDLSLKVSYTDINGKLVTATVEKAWLYNEEKGYYAFRFNQLLASELRSVLTVQVYEGDTPLSCTLTYSADSYGSNKTETLKQLCKALYAYADSAKAYFK